MKIVQCSIVNTFIIVMCVDNSNGPNGEDVSLEILSKREDDTLYPKGKIWFKTQKRAKAWFETIKDAKEFLKVIEEIKKQ